LFRKSFGDKKKKREYANGECLTTDFCCNGLHKLAGHNPNETFEKTENKTKNKNPRILM
jgi:hypothetical protein